MFFMKVARLALALAGSPVAMLAIHGRWDWPLWLSWHSGAPGHPGHGFRSSVVSCQCHKPPNGRFMALILPISMKNLHESSMNHGMLWDLRIRICDSSEFSCKHELRRGPDPVLYLSNRQSWYSRYFQGARDRNDRGCWSDVVPLMFHAVMNHTAVGVNHH